MKSNVEVVDQIRRSIVVEASAEAVGRAHKAVLDNLRKDANIPGFRKGKVPDHMLIKRYGDEIEKETMKKVVQDTYPDAVADAGANPIGPPSVEPKGHLELGKPFGYKATFEVYPEFNLKEYEGINLEREKVDVTDAEVELELKRLQQHMTQLEPAPDGKLSAGMVAMIDFKGHAGGEVFPGSEAENYVIDFGSGNLLKDFEVQIEGMGAGDTREIEFHYPKDYFRKDIAGKKGAFTVKAKEVRRKIVPNLDDEFAKELGQYKMLDDVRADLKKKILDFKNLIERNKLIEQAIRSLIDRHKDLEVPTALIDSELGNMLEQLKKQMESQGRRIEDSKIDAKEFVKTNLEEAKNRARGYMVVSAIAAKEDVKVTDQEVDFRINQIATQQKQPAAKVRQDLEDKKQLSGIRSQLVFEKTLDLILSRAKIKDVKPKKPKK